jgi:hypothetical protein
MVYGLGFARFQLLVLGLVGFRSKGSWIGD